METLFSTRIQVQHIVISRVSRDPVKFFQCRYDHIHVSYHMYLVINVLFLHRCFLVVSFSLSSSIYGYKAYGNSTLFCIFSRIIFISRMNYMFRNIQLIFLTDIALYLYMYRYHFLSNIFI